MHVYNSFISFLLCLRLNNIPREREGERKVVDKQAKKQNRAQYKILEISYSRCKVGFSVFTLNKIKTLAKCWMKQFGGMHNKSRENISGGNKRKSQNEPWRVFLCSVFQLNTVSLIVGKPTTESCTTMKRWVSPCKNIYWTDSFYYWQLRICNSSLSIHPLIGRTNFTQTCPESRLGSLQVNWIENYLFFLVFCHTKQFHSIVIRNE